MEAKGLIFDIHRGTTHDGPGFRTSIFMKGCGLKCPWCHNPESICTKQELWWSSKKCINCNICVENCQNNCIKFDKNGIIINKTLCKECFNCASVCPSKALSVVGKEWTIDEIIEEATSDFMFYNEFNGGVTISGGEPLLQHQFVKDILIKLKNMNIDTAIDTCGAVSQKNLMEIFPFVDHFLFDIKIIDNNMHKKFTGVDNKIILENVKWLSQNCNKNNKNLWIRTPIIPNATYSLENLENIAYFLHDQLNMNFDRWELCAFNNICNHKYLKLGKKWHYTDTPLIKEKDISPILEKIKTIAGENIYLTGLTAK